MATEHPTKHSRNFQDLTGQHFGRLVVVAFAGTDRHQFSRWVCQCDCGRVVVVCKGALRGGKTRSCGCLQRELLIRRSLRHGEAQGGTPGPEYRTWHAMKTRCLNPRRKGFKNYGGRGIRVCTGWRDSFSNFLADMGRRPGPGYSIDRKDNDGNYSCGHCPECRAKGWPANCRWATRKEQRSNQRKCG